MIKINIEEKGDIVIIYFFGELASANFYDIDSEVLEAFKREPEIVALNLNGLDIIDSTGISFLVKIRKTATINNKKLIMYSIPVKIMELFVIAGIENFFNIMSVEEFEHEYLII